MKSTRNIAYVIIALIAVLIAISLYNKYKGRNNESGFLNLRKGKAFCEKMCGGTSNKACLDECKTKTGFYGCC